MLSRLAWGAWAMSVAMFAFVVYVWSLPPSLLGSLSIRPLSAWVFILTAATMGALVASRRPRHPIGWWLCVLAFGLARDIVPAQYASYALVRHPGGLPASNPFVLSWLPTLPGRGSPGLTVALCCIVLALLSLATRLRRARGIEGQQLKWFAFGAARLWVNGLRFLFVACGYPSQSTLNQEVLPTVSAVSLLLLPVTMAIGILRYRLFDIDVIINRTLVYGAVTALLAGTFAGLSMVTQRVALTVTGQESQAAVVLAALVVTALFQPVRGRVQTTVDRRFYRSRYDASRTLERFANRVRDEVELDHLATSLLTVVTETMQPSHTSLWLRQRSQPPVAAHAERAS